MVTKANKQETKKVNRVIEEFKKAKAEATRDRSRKILAVSALLIIGISLVGIFGSK